MVALKFERCKAPRSVSVADSFQGASHMSFVSDRNSKKVENMKSLWMTALALGLFAFAGCEQTAQDKQAEEVREDSQQQAEDVRDQGENQAEAVRDSADNAENKADAIEDATENKADAIEDRGEQKADNIEASDDNSTSPAVDPANP